MRRGTEALTVLDLLVNAAILAVLVWLLRLNWRRDQPEPPAAVHSATCSSRTSV